MTAAMPSSRTPPTSEPSRERLWLGIVAAPVAWTVAELVGYVLVARSCEPGAYNVPPHGAEGARVWMAIVVILMTIVAVIGLFLSIANVRALSYRPYRHHEPPYDEVTRDPNARATRAYFMAIAGVLVSATFLLGIVLFGLPSLIVNTCVQTR